MITLATIFWLIFVVCVTGITFIDANSYRIPNIYVGALALIGCFAILLLSPSAIGGHLIIAGIALATGYALYQFTGFGAGDAKFIAAVMLWLGAGGVIPFLFWFGVSCALLVIALVIGRRLHSIEKGSKNIWRPLQKGAPVPLALAIGPAAILASMQLENGFWREPLTLFGWS